MVSKLHLVDLAGSERQKKTKAEGDRLKEGECNHIHFYLYQCTITRGGQYTSRNVWLSSLSWLLLAFVIFFFFFSPNV